jgi:neurotransmitter:Na+ symporter, NSS family
MKRETWKSQCGFVFAAIGSAVGLANIWRFPYMVGKNGGAAFVILYLICLFVIGFPTFISEVTLGRKAQRNPVGTFESIGGKKWKWGGGIMVLTALIVSSFYSVVAGWILGYCIQGVKGNLTSFTEVSQPLALFENLISNSFWALGYHFLFMILCVLFLIGGVRRGIERGNVVMMPVLFAILCFIVVKGVLLPNAEVGLSFLFSPDWSVVTPAVVLMALGQAFFTLSIGQGTMVTYGSYLNKKHNIPKSCFPIILGDTLISLLSAVAIFTIAFSANIEPTAGEGLLFQTLPVVFSQIPGGFYIAILFFVLVLLAAITSEISAMEVVVAFLIDEWKIKRKIAVCITAILAFLIGVPIALSFGVLGDITIYGKTLLGVVDYLATTLLIPLGGLLSVILFGWRWGTTKGFKHLREGAETFFDTQRWFSGYLYICIKFLAPIIIVFIFLQTIGLI